MRLMGIDYGTKRVGIALSDDQGLMAFPKVVLANDAMLLERVTDLVEAEDVSEIVIGHSKDRSGTDNPVHAATTEFIGDMTLRLGVPIHLEPEQYTTQEAIRFQGRSEDTDASAAAIILNSFIVRRKNKVD